MSVAERASLYDKENMRFEHLLYVCEAQEYEYMT